MEAMSLLFSPITINGLELKNRIMMAPMGTVAALDDGKLTDWHMIHYGARALGQAGLIMLEATAVKEQGRDLHGNLGLWNDEQGAKLQALVQVLHQSGSKAGIQLWHAGRKRKIEGAAVSASGIPYEGRSTEALSEQQASETVAAFRDAARRAAAAGVDVIELHAAHGYLINDFLSRYTNKRDDKYGGTRLRRYQLLREIIAEIRLGWKGPLFVRISADEYSAEGNNIDDAIYFAGLMKEQGVDLIDVSSGGILPAKPHVYPGYQVPFAEQIKREAGVATAAVGLITSGKQAEQILQDGRADLIAVGRPFLRDPFWPRTAAEQLGVKLKEPAPYKGYWFAKEPEHES